MTKLDKARELVRQFSIPEALAKLDGGSISYYNGKSTVFAEEVTSEVLAESLAYLIEIKTEHVSDESSVPLGASKYKGLPHLPTDLTWPEDQYFVAQFNLQQLHALDIEGVLPESGMLYFFFDPSAECTVLHYDGPLDALAVRQYPDEASLPDARHYLAGFKKDASEITFAPGYLFYLGGDAYDYRDSAKHIPDDLKQKLSSTLGCDLLDWDSGLRIFGRPLCWQGEDEMLDDFEGMDPAMLEEMGVPAPNSDPKHLLLQDEFGEGNIQFWVDAEGAEKGDFSHCWLSYSGT